jgi:hypothetical protein
LFPARRLKREYSEEEEEDDDDLLLLPMPAPPTPATEAEIGAPSAVHMTAGSANRIRRPKLGSPGGGSWSWN